LEKKKGKIKNKKLCVEINIIYNIKLKLSKKLKERNVRISINIE